MIFIQKYIYYFIFLLFFRFLYIPYSCQSFIQGNITLSYPSITRSKLFFHKSDAKTTEHYKILMFPDILFNSHVKLFQNVALSLHQEGHHATLLVSKTRQVDPSPHHTLEKFSGVFSIQNEEDFAQQQLNNLLKGQMYFLVFFKILQKHKSNCRQIFEEETSLLMRLKEQSYDLMLVDSNDPCGFLVAYKLNIPYAVLVTGMWIPSPAMPAAPLCCIPEFNSLLTNRMTFISRLENLLFSIGTKMIMEALIYPMYDALIFQYKIGSSSTYQKPIMSSLIHNTSLWLLSTDIALDFPSPRWPHSKHIGGLTTKPALPLSNDLLEFVEASKKHGGFIIVSFGAENRKLTRYLEDIFIKVLSNLPYSVIWRYSLEDTSLLNSNVKLVDWFPQNDLLGHPYALALVNHGGLNGVYEALYHKVPIVGLPLFGDQFDTMVRVQEKKMGIFLNWKKLSASKLDHAIRTVISSPEYKQSVQYYSTIFKDKTLPPLLQVVQSIVYVIRYKGAPHLRSTILYTPWYKILYIDWIITLFITVYTFSILLSFIKK